MRVAGDSMRPTLADGAWVVVVAPPSRGPRQGQVVVAVHPQRSELELIKRVVARTADGSWLWLAGDDPARSTDSDDFGPVSRSAIRAVAVARVRPWPPRWLTASGPALLASRAGGAPNLAAGAGDLRG